MRGRWLRWLRRRWLLWLVIIAFLVLVISRRVEIEELVATLLQGDGRWIGAALLLQIAYYLLYAFLYRLTLATVQVESRVPELLPVLFASVFINSLAPSGGLGGAALFVDDAARRGQSPTQATEGVLLAAVAENLGVLSVLLAGLAWLFFRHVLQAFEIAAAGIYLLYIAALTVVLFLGRWRPEYLRTLLGWLERAVNALARLLGRPGLLPPDWAARNAAEFSVAAEAIVTHPRQVARILAVALGLQVMNLASLYAIFLAFHSAVGLGTLAAGYALGLVFSVISIFPYDIGVLQGVMVIVYDTLGVPAATALLVALVFGGLNAWLPLAIGFLFLRRVRAFGGGGRS